MRGRSAEDALPGNESGVESWDPRLELLRVRVYWRRHLDCTPTKPCVKDQRVR